jgi:hypothetical protein
LRGTHIRASLDGKTVFHGGPGVFYDTDFTNIATNGAQSSPNASTGLLTSPKDRGLANATMLISTIPLELSPMSSALSVSSNLVILLLGNGTSVSSDNYLTRLN